MYTDCIYLARDRDDMCRVPGDMARKIESRIGVKVYEMCIDADTCINCDYYTPPAFDEAHENGVRPGSDFPATLYPAGGEI